MHLTMQGIASQRASAHYFAIAYRKRLLVLPGEAQSLGAEELVVISKLGQEERVVRDLVNDSVFIVYSPRPVTRQAMFQRFRLSDSFER